MLFFLLELLLKNSAMEIGPILPRYMAMIRMIRPDSKITMNEKGTVSAKCYDGKERTFKLDNEKRKRHE